jgi:hypothetical protein
MALVLMGSSCNSDRGTKLHAATAPAPARQCSGPSVAFTRSGQSSGISAAAQQSDANALQPPRRRPVRLLFSWAPATPGAGLKIPVSAVRFRPWALLPAVFARDGTVNLDIGKFHETEPASRSNDFPCP